MLDYNLDKTTGMLSRDPKVPLTASPLEAEHFMGIAIVKVLS